MSINTYKVMLTSATGYLFFIKIGWQSKSPPFFIFFLRISIKAYVYLYRNDDHKIMMTNIALLFQQQRGRKQSLIHLGKS